MSAFNSQGKLPWEAHFRLAIELGITEHKLFKINSAIFLCYPTRVSNTPQTISSSIRSLKDIMDSKLIDHDCPGISKKRFKFIYYEGLGQQLAKIRDLQYLSAAKINQSRTAQKKSGFSALEYSRIVTSLKFIHDLFWYYSLILGTVYLPDERPGKICTEICTACNKFMERLKGKLRREHGPGHEMFLQASPDREFLENSFTDLRPFATHIHNFLNEDLPGENISSLKDASMEIK